MSEETVYGIHAVRSILERRPTALRRLLVVAGRNDRRLTELVDLARQLDPQRRQIAPS
jgi:tRNA G18 (ribose-2'-O)-methylase SpoU